MALKNLWQIQADMWTGNTTAGFERPRQVTAKTGDTTLSWLLPLIMTSLAAGLIVSALTAVVGRVIGVMSFGFYGGISFGDHVKVFLLALLIFFGYLILRALAVWGANRVSGGNASFVDAATVFAVSQTIWWLPLLVVSLLVFLLPDLGLLLFFAAYLGLNLMGELVTYTGLTRMGQYLKTPLVPYAWFSAGAVVVMILLLYLSLRVAVG